MDPPSRDASSHPQPADFLPVSPAEVRNAREEESLSTSYQSTDTVRRRPEVLVGSYGMSMNLQPNPRQAGENLVWPSRVLISFPVHCLLEIFSRDHSESDSRWQQPAKTRTCACPIPRARIHVPTNDVFPGCAVTASWTRTSKGESIEKAPDASPHIRQSPSPVPGRSLLG